MNNTKNNDFLDEIINILKDSKAIDIVVIEVSKRSSFADLMIVAEGTSSRHVNSIVLKVAKSFKKKVLSIEGLPNAEWALIDFGDIILHIFKPEMRKYYNLEKIWSETGPQEKQNFG